MQSASTKILPEARLGIAHSPSHSSELQLVHRHRIKWLAKLSMPWVKLVDPFAGEKVGMLVEVDLEDGTTAAGLYTHKYLNESVG